MILGEYLPAEFSIQFMQNKLDIETSKQQLG